MRFCNAVLTPHYSVKVAQKYSLKYDYNDEKTQGVDNGECKSYTNYRFVNLIDK